MVRELIQRWSFGPVTLLGDESNATLPIPAKCLRCRMIKAPEALEATLDALWRIEGPRPRNLHTLPAFVRLNELCQRLYPNAGVSSGINYALTNALQALGMPSGLPPWRSDLALPIPEAARRLDAAFRRTRSKRIHLCPLDSADDGLPALTFGPNSIRHLSAAELRDTVDPSRLRRIHDSWVFDTERFSQFAWLIVEEDILLDSEPGARAMPFLYKSLRHDFGSIDPHPKSFPDAVEDALFALLLIPWEQYVDYCDLDWRAFRVPWVYTIEDDLFRRPTPPPSADTLSWQPDFVQDQDGEEIEIERPIRLPLNDQARLAVDRLNDLMWQDLLRFRGSPLFVPTVAHFIVRAFQGTGIDEFLAHMTAIEATFGLKIDYDSGKRPRVEGKNISATARVAARLSAASGSDTAAADFRRLFDIRSQFLHGRTMTSISGADRELARRLAREGAIGLMRAALARGQSADRETYLNELLAAGF